MIYVFDTHPIMKYFMKQKGYEDVIRFLRHHRHDDLRMSVISLGEVYYSIMKKIDAHSADDAIEDVRKICTIEPIDDDLVISAARYKGARKMSYADAFAAATTKRLNASLVTGDPEFKGMEKEIKIVWI